MLIYRADGPDLWIVDENGNKKQWMGRLDPKLIASVVGT
jgi:hypothetical protein